LDTSQLLEAWGTLGATGVLSLLFGFMITNIIKSQNIQNENLDKIAIEMAKSQETTSNVEGILLKLLTRLDKSDDKLDRKVDDIKRDLSDVDNTMSEIKGSLSRINGRH